MKEVKEWYAKIKEWLAHPRYRALTILGFYFVFFLVLSILFRTGNRNSLPTVSTLEKFRIGNNYEYQMTVEQDGKLDQFHGTRYQQKELITDSSTGKRIYVEDQHYYEIVSQKKIPFSGVINGIRFARLTPNYLVKYIKVGIEESKTAYQDNRLKTVYQIPKTSWEELYEGQKKENSSGNVVLTTIEKGNQIQEVELTIQNDLGSFKIEIVYSNIGQVRDFSVHLEG